MTIMDDRSGHESQIELPDACVFYTQRVPADSLPAKKRKFHSRHKDKNTSHFDSVFPKLLDGRENPEFVEARLAAFMHLWPLKHAEMERVLDDANAETTKRILEFVTSVEIDGSSSRLPAALINAGLGSSASGSLYDSVMQSVRQTEDVVMFKVHATECHNLKAALKAIIQHGISYVDMDTDDDETLEIKEGPRFLNYDLQALHNFVCSRNVSRCSVFFQNSEALDPQVLAELVDILLAWNDRIPFILLFETAISAELFQEKLPRNTVRQLHGALFESKPAMDILDSLFAAAVEGSSECPLQIGPQASRLLLDRQTEHIASAKGFISALKFCFMMHFYHNPLSFLCYEGTAHVLQNEHATFLRTLPSFRRHAEILSGDGKSDEARKLASNDSYLLACTRVILQSSRAALSNIQHALGLLMTINEFTRFRSNLTYSSLYIRALAGELVDSAVIRDLISSVRRLRSDRMLELLLRIHGSPVLSTADIEMQISSLNAQICKGNLPIRSAYDSGHETVRTVVKGEKVMLDNERKKPNPLVAEYTKVVDRVDLMLVSCMAKTLAAPRDICFHEVLIYDGKSSFRDALSGAPRAVLERALSRPHDYLACKCCDMMEGQLAASQPGTALLYQLYLESGATINIQDLWLAFYAILGDDQRGEGESSQDQMLSLFHRALAELRYLGILKNNKKKADHLAKVRWKGL